MKKDQVFVAMIIGFLMTLMVTSAQANGWTDKGNVYRNGVSIGSIYDVKMQEPGMTSEKATSDIKRFYAEQAIQRKKERDQEERARKRALIHVPTPEEVAAIKAEIARIIEEGGQPSLDLVSPDKVNVIEKRLEEFYKSEHFKGTPEQAAEMIELFATPMTLAETTTLVQSVYGPEYTQDTVKYLLENASAKELGDATTWAIKYLTGTLDK